MRGLLMFVKILTKNLKSGPRYYASIVENNSVNGKIVQSVIVYIGEVKLDQIPYLKAAYAKKKPRLVYED